jgi:glutathione S-transferase
MNQYKLYGRFGAGSLAPQIVLEDMGVPYEMVWVSKDAADVENLRRVNSTGKIPALILPDGTAVAESAAILIHLTLAHPTAGLAPTAGSPAHARFLQWMVYLSANVYETALRYFYAERYGLPGPSTAADIKAQALADFTKQLEFIDARLSPYLLGAEYSAADPYFHMLASWYPGDMQALRARLPKLAEHAELLRRRPSTRKAEKDHEEK